MTSKERILATIKGQAHDRTAVTPIFMAWSAHFIGRTYRDYYLNGDVLVQAQLAVVKAFNIDQISVISDPWREASAYGLKLDYPEQGVGIPREPLIQSSDDMGMRGRFLLQDMQLLRKKYFGVFEIMLMLSYRVTISS